MGISKNSPQATKMVQIVGSKEKYFFHFFIKIIFSKFHSWVFISIQHKWGRPPTHTKLLLNRQRAVSSKIEMFWWPYILAYKSKNFGQNLWVVLPIRLIHESGLWPICRCFFSCKNWNVSSKFWLWLIHGSTYMLVYTVSVSLNIQ